MVVARAPTSSRNDRIESQTSEPSYRLRPREQQIEVIEDFDAEVEEQKLDNQLAKMDVPFN